MYQIINGEVIALTNEEIAAWKASQPTADEITARKWVGIRSRRNGLLTATDWRATSDLTLSDAWKDYRQALRDVPAQTDVDNIVWPTEPS
tara:strand:+ start:1014 stop:1283 length:270 start_codon:yes stop_codon:yes gene_type:complete